MTGLEITRARRCGPLIRGGLPPAPLNAITDVEGVEVGHATIIEGEGLLEGRVISPAAITPPDAENTVPT